MEYLLQIRDTDSEKIDSHCQDYVKSFSKLLGREAKGSEGWSQVAYSGSCLNMDNGSRGRC